MSTTTFNTATFRRIVRAGTTTSFGSRPGMRRHRWTERDLQELSLAYIEHKGQMPLWKIADMLQFSFSSPKPSRNEDDDDAPMIETPNPANKRVPSISAIMSKLMDCVYLETGGLLGYETVKPSLLHYHVWKHIKLSQKHREMIAEMKIKSEENAAKSQPEEEPQPQPQPQPQSSSTSSSSHRCSIGKVHGRNSDDECPPAKRRKIITDDDNTSENEMRDNSNLESVMASLDQRLANLSLQFGGVFAEIESIRGDITNALLPPPSQMSIAAAPVCSKCDKHIEGELGGFSVSYTDPSQPQGTYECYECCSLSPSEIKFIERRQAELEAEYEEQRQQPVSPVYSDYDSDEYWEEDYHNGYGYGYDHSEECS